jgi:hypothetical protein
MTKPHTRAARSPHLKNHRNQPLFPRRVLQPVAALLRQLAELTEAIGREVDDAQWGEASGAFERAARCLDVPQESEPTSKERA